MTSLFLLAGAEDRGPPPPPAQTCHQDPRPGVFPESEDVSLSRGGDSEGQTALVAVRTAQPSPSGAQVHLHPGLLTTHVIGAGLEGSHIFWEWGGAGGPAGLGKTSRSSPRVLPVPSECTSQGCWRDAQPHPTEGSLSQCVGWCHGSALSTPSSPRVRIASDLDSIMP